MVSSKVAPLLIRVVAGCVSHGHESVQTHGANYARKNLEHLGCERHTFVAIKYAGLAGLKWCAGLLLPWAFIWFPEEIGSLTGYFRTGYVNVQTPGGMVSFMGWFFLVGVRVLLFLLCRR